MSEKGDRLAGQIMPWLSAQLGEAGRKPFVLGICGAQGSGKSTLAGALSRQLAAEGLRCATLSLDDLYLDGARRRSLAYAVHPLFVVRGVPGTHDTALGQRIFEEFDRDEGAVVLPRFDKAADEPRRRQCWPALGVPLDVLIFEGWCVGAHPQAAKALRTPVNELEAVEDVEAVWRTYANERLAGDYQRLFARLDRSILLKAPSFDVVMKWRLEQERDLARRGGAGGRTMNEAQVRRFILFFERLTRHILDKGSSWYDLVIPLNEARRPELVAVGA